MKPFWFISLNLTQFSMYQSHYIWSVLSGQLSCQPAPCHIKNTNCQQMIFICLCFKLSLIFFGIPCKSLRTPVSQSQCESKQISGKRNKFNFFYSVKAYGMIKTNLNKNVKKFLDKLKSLFPLYPKYYKPCRVTFHSQRKDIY